MKDPVNKFAREMADAMAAAVSNDPRVEACRAKARAAGYEMQVSLEAVIGFSPAAGATDRETRPVRVQKRPLEISAHDRRFLRSLRIATDEPIQQPE